MPRTTRTKPLSLSLYLIKQGANESALFRSTAGLGIHTVSYETQRLGKLYVRQSDEKRPTWTRLFMGRVTPDISNVRSKSVSALWVIPVGTRLFAAAFGYGRMLLSPGSFEEDFGLKVTLNCVDPNKVHSIDRTTLDTLHTSVLIDFRDVTNLLEQYLALYQSTRYKDFFAFVDHIRLIRDPVRIQGLNDALSRRSKIRMPIDFGSASRKRSTGN